MPNMTLGEPDFSKSRGYWFGWAVSRRRKALRLTASELSRRTAGLGFPITRSTIAKIESNLRSGKIDLAEILVLAAALDVPPVLLMFPQFGTDGGAMVIPGYTARENDAVRWLSGQLAFPQQYDLDRLQGEPRAANAGVALLNTQESLEDAIDRQVSLEVLLGKAEKRGNAEQIENITHLLERDSEAISTLRQRKKELIRMVWGFGSDFDEDSDESDGTDGDDI